MVYVIIAVSIFFIIGFLGKKNDIKPKTNKVKKTDKKKIPEKIGKIGQKRIRKITFRGDSKNYVRQIEEIEDPNWQKIYRKSERWFEMKFDEKFPGYGKLYNRFFDVWYCEVGSKEKKNIQSHTDTFPEHYTPDNYEIITKTDVNFEKLVNSQNYKFLFSGLDKKNRKRWYFGIKKIEPTGIEIISL